MNAQQLKNSILQMAVQGKLVPQDPKDEPASVLLERIREEKEKLIKEGKIKKDKDPSYIFRGKDNLPYEKVGKNEPVCIADEVPFEIPESWEWARLKNLGITQTGNTPSKAHSEFFGNDIPFIGPGNIQNEQIDYGDKGLSLEGELVGRIAESNSILQVCIGGSIGKAAINKKKVAFNQQINAISPVIVETEYLYYCLVSPYIIEYMHDYAGGTATPIINRGLWDELIIPIPPLAEQNRIISKYKSISTYIDRYGIVCSQLEMLNTDFPALLKKSILQQAVMGKLVPQDPNDKPASVLLENIRAEKAASIKAGNLKKDKHESIIYRRDNSYFEKVDDKEVCIDEEIPFDIPETWEWVRLGNIVSYQNGYAFSKSDYSKHDKGIPVIKSNNLMTLHVKLNNKTNYIETPNHKMLESQIKENDLLMCLSSQSENTEPLGKTAIFDLGIPALLNQRVLKMTAYDISIVEWLYYSINSEYFHYTVSHRSGGSAQSNLKLEHVLTMLIPIPPYEEQLRIINVINIFFSKLSAL